MKPLRLVVLLSSCVIALSLVTWSVIDGVARMRAASAMAEAANKFLASLTPEQKAKASLDFADENRRDWTVVPRDRKGVPLKDLDENQRKLAMEFMKTGLGASGYQKATTIMSLEPVLAQLEGPSRRFPRDPELYYFSVFGTPSPKAPWGWRVEGHHISIHFTIVKGEMLSNTPLAFGSNPAEVREGERKGLRALAGEEDAGGRLRQDIFRLGGRRQQRRSALLPGAEPDVFDRIRQHAEQRQSHTHGLARFQRRFRRGFAARALSGDAAQRVGEDRDGTRHV